MRTVVAAAAAGSTLFTSCRRDSSSNSAREMVRVEFMGAIEVSLCTHRFEQYSGPFPRGEKSVTHALVLCCAALCGWKIPLSCDDLMPHYNRAPMQGQRGAPFTNRSKLHIVPRKGHWSSSSTSSSSSSSSPLSSDSKAPSSSSELKSSKRKGLTVSPPSSSSSSSFSSW